MSGCLYLLYLCWTLTCMPQKCFVLGAYKAWKKRNFRVRRAYPVLGLGLGARAHLCSFLLLRHLCPTSTCSIQHTTCSRVCCSIQHIRYLFFTVEPQPAIACTQVYFNGHAHGSVTHCGICLVTNGCTRMGWFQHTHYDRVDGSRCVIQCRDRSALL